MEWVKVDVLILGGGGAGLFCALHAWDKDPSLRIAIASKGLVGQSGCTRMVQGGYNAVLDPNDSLDLHFLDTVKGGGFINNQELAWTLVSDAPKRIHDLERWGCFFDRRADGRIYQKPFAGQSFDRTVHRGDLTGIEIMSRLKDQLFRTDITLLDEYRGVELLTDSGGGVVGALVLQTQTGEFLIVEAGAVVMATGGGATMYRISAPSLEKAGDGMAMAYRAGAAMQDMEMMQFHPTGLLAGESVLTGSVLEEGLRGAGGYLLNGLGERYMERYDPERMERSTRDLVSRAGYMEIMAGRGSANGGVFIDVSHLGAEFVELNFPGMCERVKEVGFDLAHGPVEVSPTAHFHMGGVRTDVDCFTGIPGLLVAGEDAGGVHGSNRLGGNGVAESTVYGARAGDAVVEYARRSHGGQPSQAQADEAMARATAPLGRQNGESIFSIRKEIEGVMWENVGLVRDGQGLQEALGKLQALEERAQQAAVPGFPEYNISWQEYLNVRNILTVASLIARSALERTESRGSHYRSDFPESRDEWLKNIYMRGSDDGLLIWDEPVQFTRIHPNDA
ncbi:MAG: FAD-binding protein [Dehalococcoidia bacterium]